MSNAMLGGWDGTEREGRPEGGGCDDGLENVTAMPMQQLPEIVLKPGDWTTGQTASFDSLATADLCPNRPSTPTEGRLQGQRAIAAEDGTSTSVLRV